ncbi:hypothetical protein F4680DRAFT_267235 [Xylaria scruposa]|nr:hypothetical protein F4680DRAFT_267235 [Xylaria scruposa]
MRPCSCSASASFLVVRAPLLGCMTSFCWQNIPLPFHFSRLNIYIRPLRSSFRRFVSSPSSSSLNDKSLHNSPSFFQRLDPDPISNSPGATFLLSRSQANHWISSLSFTHHALFLRNDKAVDRFVIPCFVASVLLSSCQL